MQIVTCRVTMHMQIATDQPQAGIYINLGGLTHILHCRCLSSDLGTYDTEEEAAMAYDHAALQHRSSSTDDKAITNFDHRRYFASDGVTLLPLQEVIDAFLQSSTLEHQQLQADRVMEITDDGGSGSAAAQPNRLRAEIGQAAEGAIDGVAVPSRKVQWARGKQPMGRRPRQTKRRQKYDDEEDDSDGVGGEMSSGDTLTDDDDGEDDAPRKVCHSRGGTTIGASQEGRGGRRRRAPPSHSPRRYLPYEASGSKRHKSASMVELLMSSPTVQAAAAATTQGTAAGEVQLLKQQPAVRSATLAKGRLGLQADANRWCYNQQQPCSKTEHRASSFGIPDLPALRMPQRACAEKGLAGRYRSNCSADARGIEVPGDSPILMPLFMEREILGGISDGKGEGSPDAAQIWSKSILRDMNPYDTFKDNSSARCLLAPSSTKVRVTM